MKHLQTFESFLFEFKQVGVIYHFTLFDSLEGILEEDRMESSAMFDYISFTRNPLFKFHRRNCRITFDGDEMSNRFHFEPFLYDPEKDPMFYDPEHIDYKERRELYGDEREERITKKEIKGIKKYITAIEIIRGKDEDFEKRLVKLEEANPQIEFRIVKSFSPRSKELQRLAA